VLLTKLRTSLNALVKKGLAGAKQAGTQRPQPVTMLLQPLTAYLKLHIRTVPDNKLKTNISLGTHA
jgi:hypothetical protein